MRSRYIAQAAYCIEICNQNLLKVLGRRCDLTREGSAVEYGLTWHISSEPLTAYLSAQRLPYGGSSDCFALQLSLSEHGLLNYMARIACQTAWVV